MGTATGHGGRHLFLRDEILNDGCMSYFVPYKIRHFLFPWRLDAEGWAKRDDMDIGGTSPWMGEGRIMQEQLTPLNSVTSRHTESCILKSLGDKRVGLTIE